MTPDEGNVITSKLEEEFMDPLVQCQLLKFYLKNCVRKTLSYIVNNYKKK